MRQLLKNLFTLWMVWALALLPLQSFGDLPVAADTGPCTMHAAAAAQQHAAAHAGHHDAMPEPCPACQHCSQQDCDGDECAAGGCSGMHLQPAVLFSLSTHLLPAAATGEALPPGDIYSRTDPPPLPPPV